MIRHSVGGTDKPVLRFVSETLFAMITTDKRLPLVSATHFFMRLCLVLTVSQLAPQP